MPCFHCEEPGASGPARPERCGGARRTAGSSSSSRACASAARAAIAACPWGTPSGTRPRARSSVRLLLAKDRLDAGAGARLRDEVRDRLPFLRCRQRACGPASRALRPSDPRRAAGRRLRSSHERTPDAAVVARRGRRGPDGRGAAGADPRRRAARPRAGPVDDAPPAAAALAAIGPAGVAVVRASRSTSPGANSFAARGPSVLVDRRDRLRCARARLRPRFSTTRRGGSPRGYLIAIGLRDSDKVELRLPAGAQRPRSGPPERQPTPYVRSPRSPSPAGRSRWSATAGRAAGGRGVPPTVTARPHTGDLVPDRLAVRRRVGARCVVADAPARHESARPRRAGSGREPAGADRRLGRRRCAGRGLLARFRRRLGRFPPAFRGGSDVRPAVARVRGNRARAFQFDGDGRGNVPRQADRPRALPALATCRWRRNAGARPARARRALDRGDQPRSRRRRAPRRARRGRSGARGPGAGGRLAARQRVTPLPRTVGTPCPARVLPGGALPRAQSRAVPQHVPGQHRHPELHRAPWPR